MWGIIGDNHFLGGVFIRRLLASGRRGRVLSSKPIHVGERGRPLEFSTADLLTVSPAYLMDFLKGINTLFLFIDRFDREPDDLGSLHDLHVEVTRKILAVARLTGPKRILLLSTSGTVAISRHPDRLADEDSPYAEKETAGHSYFSSKIEQEKLALAWASETQSELLILRPSLLLGPGDDEIRTTVDIQRFLEREVPLIPSGGISFVDVRDVAEAFLRAGEMKLKERGPRRHGYLLGAANWTLRRFYQVLGDISGMGGPILPAGGRLSSLAKKIWAAPVNPLTRFVETDFPPPAPPHAYWAVDSEAARRDLELTFRDPTETIRDTIEYLRAR